MITHRPPWGDKSSGGEVYAPCCGAQDGTATNLNPPGYGTSFAEGTDGTRQVGYGTGPTGPGALLWSGTAASAVSLNPIGAATSEAIGIASGQQVGYAKLLTAVGTHAYLWSGTAASAVDLNPVGFAFSGAFGTDGVHQVGLANVAVGDNLPHAILWSGTAAGAVDLTPAGFVNAEAGGVKGNQQVGLGKTSAGPVHALLWTGTAASAVDLNPLGIASSFTNGTNGSKQVGGGDGRALVWSGTAASAVDLSSSLPASGSWGSSTAYSIDANGNIFGLAHGTYNSNSDEFAVEWMPLVPGDFNRDGHRNAADIKAMEGALVDLTSYRNSNSDLTNAQVKYLEDVNADGTVNNADLQQLLTVLQTGGGTSAPVPEPMSAI